MTRTRVLFIAGCGRSGSTLIERILGQLPGVESVGELRHFWTEAAGGNRLCGCGEPILSCPFWAAVIRHLYGPKPVHQLTQLSVLPELVRTRHLPLLQSGMAEARFSRRVRGLTDELSRLLNTIRSETGAKLIVDSSKFPSYGWALSTVPEIDLFVLHLVRDPRAVAYSWWHRRRGEPGLRSRMAGLTESPAKVAIRWILWNTFIESEWGRVPERYYRIRYEDFVRDPEPALVAVLDWIGVANDELPFTSGDEVRLLPTHSALGNPNRFQTGSVHIQPDEAWKTELPVRDRRLVTALTAPVLKRYGYSIGIR